MREIKFRAYQDGKMYNVGGIVFHPVTGEIVKLVGIISDTEAITLDNYELSEFTGLKDKNGTDIYKGDIAKADYIYFKLTVCEWDKELLRYVFRSLNGSRLDDLPLTIHTREEFEVIGNIYENPELCKD